MTDDASSRPPLVSHLRKLFQQSAVYGAADVFSQVTSVLLIPVFTAYMGPEEYGDLAILALFGAVAKIAFRLGLDAGFFRVYYDNGPEITRRLAGSVALFAAVSGAALFAAIALSRGPLTRALLGEGSPPLYVVLVAADLAVGMLAFVPLNLLRIQDRPGRFSMLAALRHGINIVLKVVLVVSGLGVTGVLVSDLIATVVFTAALMPILLQHAEPSFSWGLLRPVLSFGLPKVPHGLLVQVQNLADRKLLDLFLPRASVGIYHVGYLVGTGVKFALSAFEPAWGPFVYSQISRPDAPRTLARVVTFAWFAFCLVGLGVAALAGEILHVLTPFQPAFRAAAPVVPVVVLAYLLHGAYLLTSIGIGIEKASRYYPVISAASAATNIACNLALIPRLGMLGAAWATVASYAVMAGLGFVISRRLYPIPFERGRLTRISLASAGCFGLSRLAPAALVPAIITKLAIVFAFPILVAGSGFLRESEREWLRARFESRSAG